MRAPPAPATAQPTSPPGHEKKSVAPRTSPTSTSSTAPSGAPLASVRTIRPVLPELHGAGITLAIENHDRFTARQFAQIVQQLDSPAVGICLDTVNSLGALEGPDAVVTALAPWVVSLHVKEFCIRRADHQMGFIIEGRPAGQGRLNVPWLLEQLRTLWESRRGEVDGEKTDTQDGEGGDD